MKDSAQSLIVVSYETCCQKDLNDLLMSSNQRSQISLPVQRMAWQFGQGKRKIPLSLVWDPTVLVDKLCLNGVVAVFTVRAH